MLLIFSNYNDYIMKYLKEFNWKLYWFVIDFFLNILKIDFTNGKWIK